jgi:hypothetical protein
MNFKANPMFRAHSQYTIKPGLGPPQSINVRHVFVGREKFDARKRIVGFKKGPDPRPRVFRLSENAVRPSIEPLME